LGLFLDVFVSLLPFELALILFLNNALSFFFFQTYFYTWTFLCCCGAVIGGASQFNSDLSPWQVGKVTTMASST